MYQYTKILMWPIGFLLCMFLSVYGLKITYLIDTPDYGKKPFSSLTLLDSSIDLKNYGYTAVHQTSFLFEVKACHHTGVHLSSSTNRNSSEPLYNVYYDGGKSKYSVIRARKANYINTGYIIKKRIYHEPPGMLDCNVFTPHWISWKNGEIEFGKGDTARNNTVHRWIDSSPFTVKDVFIYSNYGETGEWRIAINVTENFTGHFSRCRRTNIRANVICMYCINDTKIQCSAECGRDSNCFGFNYEDNDHRCELLSINDERIDDIPLQSAFGWNFYTKCYSVMEVCFGCFF